MSTLHLAAIGSLLGMLLLLAACEGIEIRPTRIHGGHGGGDGGAHSSGR